MSSAKQNVPSPAYYPTMYGYPMYPHPNSMPHRVPAMPAPAMQAPAMPASAMPAPAMYKTPLQKKVSSFKEIPMDKNAEAKPEIMNPDLSFSIKKIGKDRAVVLSNVTHPDAISIKCALKIDQKKVNEKGEIFLHFTPDGKSYDLFVKNGENENKFVLSPERMEATFEEGKPEVNISNYHGQEIKVMSKTEGGENLSWSMTHEPESSRAIIHIDPKGGSHNVKIFAMVDGQKELIKNGKFEMHKSSMKEEILAREKESLSEDVPTPMSTPQNPPTELARAAKLENAPVSSASYMGAPVNTLSYMGAPVPTPQAHPAQQMYPGVMYPAYYGQPLHPYYYNPSA